jgi:putative hemolysin
VPDLHAPVEEAQIVPRADGSWLVDGLLAADELKERLGLQGLPNKPRGDYQTVGGLVIDQLGRIPTAGDRFEWGGFTFEVVDMDGHRVDKVLVQKA